MMRTAFLKPAYVKIVPDELEDGTLYVSEYGTAVHKCCCGCGSEVVTPLGPTDWKLVKEGSAVSLHPSVGNWHLPCRSHYWITRGKVIWAGQWTDEEIAAARLRESAMKDQYYNQKPKAKGFWARFWKWLTH
jgi:Family of unknown function (DUF6527)